MFSWYQNSGRKSYDSCYSIFYYTQVQYGDEKILYHCHRLKRKCKKKKREKNKIIILLFTGTETEWTTNSILSFRPARERTVRREQNIFVTAPYLDPCLSIGKIHCHTLIPIWSFPCPACAIFVILLFFILLKGLEENRIEPRVTRRPEPKQISNYSNATQGSAFFTILYFNTDTIHVNNAFKSCTITSRSFITTQNWLEFNTVSERGTCDSSMINLQHYTDIL